MAGAWLTNRTTKLQTTGSRLTVARAVANRTHFSHVEVLATQESLHFCRTPLQKDWVGLIAHPCPCDQCRQDEEINATTRHAQNTAVCTEHSSLLGRRHACKCTPIFAGLKPEMINGRSLPDRMIPEAWIVDCTSRATRTHTHEQSTPAPHVARITPMKINVATQIGN